MPVYFLGQPANRPLQDHVLVLTGGEVGIPDGLNAPGMVFLGGWDIHEQNKGETHKPLEDCLAFLYPAGNWQTTQDQDAP